MVDIDNNKLMGLLTIAGGSLLLSREHIKENNKQTRIFGQERDSEGIYSIIHDFS